MKKKCFTVETVPKSTRKNTERGKTDTPNTYMHDRSLSFLGTGWPLTVLPWYRMTAHCPSLVQAWPLTVLLWYRHDRSLSFLGTGWPLTVLPWYRMTAHCPSLVQDDRSLSFLGTGMTAHCPSLVQAWPLTVLLWYRHTDVVYVIMTGIFLNYMSFDGLGGKMS